MAGPLLAAGLTAGATLLGGLLGYQGQKEANQAGSQNVQKQMEFQERMSSSAHQREVADLRAAGLNPILSAGGGGASTPAGGAFEPENEMQAISNSALQYAQMQQQARSILVAEKAQESSERLNTTQQQKAYSDIKSNNAYQEVQKELARLQKANARNVELENKIKELEVKVAENNPKTTGALDWFIHRALPVATTGAQVGRAVAPYAK